MLGEIVLENFLNYSNIKQSRINFPPTLDNFKMDTFKRKIFTASMKNLH